MHVHLIRLEQSDQGTIGMLLAGEFQCFTAELPARDNRRNISRIPAGQYRAIAHQSPRFGPCYWVQGVPGRSGILIHPGNLAGDAEQGWKTHSNGCILLGKYRGELDIGHGLKQRAVLSSRPTVRRFLEVMGGQDFTLNIVEA